ncbi:MAG: hypothetical protein M0P14_04990 [Alkaliphilus sp.]|nr:hypothetical protein [Alkaliphilus sp.]
MKKAYIYNMAMNELLRKIEKEEEHLRTNPQSQIAPARLVRLHEEEKELHALILDAERQI